MTSQNTIDIKDILSNAVGTDIISEQTGGYSVDGVTPSFVAIPTTIEQLAAIVSAAHKGDLAIAPWSGGTRIGVGNLISKLDVVIDMSRLNGIIDHAYGDLTATVQSGITLAQLQTTLGEHKQFVALDPPLTQKATLGGTLASGASGPLKWQYGNLRDAVIGMKIVQADGTITKSGGQVVKNVSGYDMARLHIGALGSLGIIAEVSLKLTPTPTQEATLIASFDDAETCMKAGMETFHSHVMPLSLVSIDALANDKSSIWQSTGSYHLLIRLGGRPRTVARQAADFQNICRSAGATNIDSVDQDIAPGLWQTVSDFGWSDKTVPTVSARIFTKPNDALSLANKLRGLIKSDAMALTSYIGYGTTLANWYVSDDDSLKIVQAARETVHSIGGRMIVERCPSSIKASIDVWDDPGESIETMRRLKSQYDPKSVINPGRFVGGI